MGLVPGYIDDGHVGNEFASPAGDIPAVRPFSKPDVSNDRFEPRRIGRQFR
jgi:hypothetical protein